VSKLVTSLGLMSGTSLDGIDVALLETDGEHQVHRRESMTITYDADQRTLLRQALVDALKIRNSSDRPGSLSEVEQKLTDWHVNAAQQFCRKTGLSFSEIDLIGFHGQTVLHRPHERLTVQIGDGKRLSQDLGLPVAYDLRAADIAAGGQGAPLVPIYHQALAADMAERPVAFVNIGGVANITYVGADGELIAFDTGPGNALIDDWVKHHTGASHDEGGKLAASGRVDEATVAQFLGDAYFEQAYPKSLDRNAFAMIDLAGLSAADGAATLVQVTSRSIAAAARLLPREPALWIICGGGRHNASIMRALVSQLGNVKAAEAFNLNGDSMEAEAWAYLAVRCLKKLPISFPSTTGAPEPLTSGIIASPG
jgi:anhydro-N-acetylmuramic acid kinase